MAQESTMAAEVWETTMRCQRYAAVAFPGDKREEGATMAAIAGSGKTPDGVRRESLRIFAVQSCKRSHQCRGGAISYKY
ncbi:MAG: hypothetical protein APR53_03060 [Methanoculleus sp. SDB]|nr:MAG: hypothetical protein APR53_03060 [Methanoculleus sp. SDB]